MERFEATLVHRTSLPLTIIRNVICPYLRQTVYAVSRKTKALMMWHDTMEAWSPQTRQPEFSRLSRCLGLTKMDGWSLVDFVSKDVISDEEMHGVQQ